MKCLKYTGNLYCSSDDCDGVDETSCVFPKFMENIHGCNFAYKKEELLQILLEGIPEDSYYKTNFLKDENKNTFLAAFNIQYAKQNLELLQFPNFTYDRKTKLIFVCFDPGAHGMFMAKLYVLNKLKDQTASKKLQKGDWWSLIEREAFSLPVGAEKFITEGYGLFSSSVNRGFGIPREKGFPIYYSKEHKLTSQEKTIFKPYDFRAIEDE